ncbi:carboxylating nicotinate-nucleotide diphosphorylase [Helicobacter winghamensis]|uniref:nicotinate-nucleotide diphosphorylase (carboxylating) n=1 Tax=Helicobacter winghamensis TaxID=157268 RepID=A0A2N3PL93_9HELI|nr:carboxylating nicotinate-nucleotide diphosphorylase [Helicobacter winghamensis]EEO26713.1 nicotinate-nucleotide diphosphorylase (carboxylating) [Helicobacter winghamensis ATCC BAA-430]PKT79542.1 nicotinate-nucleotide diphosphorylase (carboxylating) [Helicobacter winghamensis]PKT79660.1 nicotinate-nucleotide diphosphorylase (carboxylating) [Helicobacter winghamensis]PKT79713.1 nicotinate-nucleotide diphosphorylase (carboxylating) [Helicobacter winghamensis]PKT82511.1 nicotinate-nucleotide di
MHKILLDDFLKEVLKEDIGRGDLYMRMQNEIEIEAYIIAREDGILSGKMYVERLCELLNIECDFTFEDGMPFRRGEKLVMFKGKMSEILSAERTILNLLEHSSGIATLTRKYVQRIEGTDCMLLDTRKTRPLLRDFEKYSARNGGAVNHRLGLDDCLMLKDTHLTRILALNKFVKDIRKKIPFTAKIEVECENLLQAKEALESDIDILMCDNMELETIENVVKMRNAMAPNVLLEASGNITLENILDYAKSGVDAISSGAIIHQAVWVDLSMKID